MTRFIVIAADNEITSQRFAVEADDPATAVEAVRLGHVEPFYSEHEELVEREIVRVLEDTGGTAVEADTLHRIVVTVHDREVHVDGGPLSDGGLVVEVRNYDLSSDDDPVDEHGHHYHVEEFGAGAPTAETRKP